MVDVYGFGDFDRSLTARNQTNRSWGHLSPATNQTAMEIHASHWKNQDEVLYHVQQQPRGNYLC